MSRCRKTPLYGNCIIQAPDGQSLCRVGEDKIQWYVERNLGDIVSENPITLRLAFEPKGRNGADHLYTTAEKENICVVCGTDQDITRHHVVPKCFRRFFPLHKKEHAIHDVLILCINCHNLYEEHASQFKQELADKMDISVHTTSVKNDDSIYKAKTAAFALLRDCDVIPDPRKNELLDRIRTYLNKTDISRKDIEELANIKHVNSQKPFGQLVVERLDSIDDFILIWRQHFLDTMKPAYLPIFWSVDNQL